MVIEYLWSSCFQRCKSLWDCLVMWNLHHLREHLWFGCNLKGSYSNRTIWEATAKASRAFSCVSEQILLLLTQEERNKASENIVEWACVYLPFNNQYTYVAYDLKILAVFISESVLKIYEFLFHSNIH